MKKQQSVPIKQIIILLMLASLSQCYCYNDCATCDYQYGGCTSCWSRYYLYNGYCNSCSYGCYSCNSYSVCLKCFDYAKNYCTQYQQPDNSGKIIGIIVGSVVGGLLFIFLMVFLHKRSIRQIQSQRAAEYQDQPSNQNIKNDSLQWRRLQNLKGEQTCAICLDPGNVFSQCGHFFHPNCINQWLIVHLQCPMCRKPVSKDKITVVCRKCRQFGFTKPLAEVLKLRQNDIEICGQC